MGAGGGSGGGNRGTKCIALIEKDGGLWRGTKDGGGVKAEEDAPGDTDG